MNFFEGLSVSVFWSAILFLVMALTSCCIYKKQATEIDFPKNALNAAALDTASLFLRTDDIPAEWWLLFEDDQLTSFIETAFRNNPTLHEARTQVYIALYSAQEVRAGLFPLINWGGDILREKLSETGLIPFNQKSTQTGANAPLPATGGVAGIPVYFTQYETEFTLAYDFDIWDKRRNRLKAALGEVQARIADDAFIHLELGTALAKTYFQLQVLYQRKAINQEFVDNEIKINQMKEGLVQGYLNDALFISNASARLADAKIALLNVQNEIAIKETELRGYLAGAFDESIVPIIPQVLPQVPLPAKLPLHLLSNRPDIAAELWLIQSARRHIDIAEMEFYPDFNISALFGYQTIHLHKLFEWPSSFFNINPAFSLPLFTGGLLEANLSRVESSYDSAVYRYNQLVITATKEVLDSLSRIKFGHYVLTETENKLAHQEDSSVLTYERFQNNIDSQLAYLQSQQFVLTAKDQEVLALGNILQSILDLIKALGGGYQCQTK